MATQGSTRTRTEDTVKVTPAPFRRARESGFAYWLRPVTWGLALAAFAWAVRGLSWLVRGTTNPNGWIVAFTFVAAGILALTAGLQLRDQLERVVLWAVEAVALAWVCAVWWAVAQAETLHYLLAFIVAVGALLNGANRRGRMRDDIANEMRAWPELVHGTNWAGTVMTRPRESFKWGYVLHLRRERGTRSLGQLTDANSRDELEDVLEAPNASATVERDGRSKTDLKVTVVVNDPHSKGVSWDGVPARSITDEVSIGVYDDDDEECTRWWTRGVGGFHRLMAGMTRSGKSTLMKLLACLYGPAEDTILWFIDLKGGMSFRRLFPLGDWSARKAEDALAMLRSANAVIEERSHLAGDAGMDPWEPAPPYLTDEDGHPVYDDDGELVARPLAQGGPVYLVVIDELAKLIGMNAPRWVANEAVPLIVNIAQQGAGVGVLLCMATQFPTLEALATSQLREQIEWAACFRLRDTGTAHYVLPNAGSQVEPAKIDAKRRGTCYVDAQGELRQATLRCRDITADQIDQTVRSWWDRAPSPPEYDVAVYDPAYDHREIWTPDGVTYVSDPDEDLPADDTPAGDYDDDTPIPQVPCPNPDCGAPGTASAAVEGICPDCALTFDFGHRQQLALAALAVAGHDPTELVLTPDHEETAVPAPTLTFADLIAEETAQLTPDQRAEREAAAAALRGPDGDTPEDQACALGWQALLDAGVKGCAPKDIRLAADRGEAWSFGFLAALRAQGLVDRAGYGRYTVDRSVSHAPDMAAVRRAMNPPRARATTDQ